jgi:hypothetical protein
MRRYALTLMVTMRCRPGGVWAGSAEASVAAGTLIELNRPARRNCVA